MHFRENDLKGIIVDWSDTVTENGGLIEAIGDTLYSWPFVARNPMDEHKCLQTVANQMEAAEKCADIKECIIWPPSRP